jgi:hypothetical protein
MEGKEMRRFQALGLLLLLLLALGPVSCGTQTALETHWQLPNLESGPFTKLAVIGILKSKDEGRSFESAVVEKFEKHGVQAVPGFSFLDDKKDLSKDEMEKMVAGTGADGVLMFKVIGVDKKNHYVPPTTYIAPDPLPRDWWRDDYWGYYNPYPYSYWGYWYPAVQVVTTPGYWESSKTYRIESTLYKVSDNKLVWTAVSDTYDPRNQADMASSLAGIVLEKLKQGGLVNTK